MAVELDQQINLSEFNLRPLPETVRELVERSLVLTTCTIEGTWPPLRTVSELNRQIPQIHQLAQELFDALRPLRTPDSSWSEAMEEARWKAIYDENDQFHQKNKVRNVWRIVDGIGRNGEACLSDHPSFEYHAWWDAQGGFRRAAGWEMLKDQLGDLNPFLPLVEFYELGATAINFYLVNKQEMLVIDFPLKGKYQGEVACLAFGDGEPGDRRVFYVHERTARCPDNRPMAVPRRIITDPP